MSSPNYYTITLTPESRFFFGSEITFGQSGEQKRRRSYLVKSEVLPQQTSLLGMLRYELLRENSLLAPYDTNDNRQQAAEALVGTTGFVVDDKPDYGVIDALSPLLLTDGKQRWVPEPLDDGAYENKDKKTTNAFCWQKTKSGNWKLKHYNPKAPRYARFVREDGRFAHDLDDCFSSVTLVGNRISNRLYRPGESSEEDEEGLFRQTFRSACKTLPVNEDNPPAFSFVFRVAIKGNVLDAFLTNEGAANEVGAYAERSRGTDAEERKKARLVFLGAERSAFLMTVAVANDLNLVPTPTYRTNTKSLSGTARIVLTSDAFLPEKLFAKCRDHPDYFLMANVKTFRFLSSRLDDTTSFASLRRSETKDDTETTTENQTKKGRRRESDLFQLAERGGVLLVPTEQADTVVQQIENQTAFHTIGYNHCAVASITPKA